MLHIVYSSSDVRNTSLTILNTEDNNMFVHCDIANHANKINKRQIIKEFELIIINKWSYTWNAQSK